MDTILNKKIRLALLGNIVPFFGILFFQWSVFSLLLSYWLENVVIGVYQFLKMRRATVDYPVDKNNRLTIGPFRPVQAKERLFFPIFFLVHYGFFLFGHFNFLHFFGGIGSVSLSFSSTILVSAIPFFLIHGKSYFEKYIGEKEYEKIPLAKLFIGPYRRIVILHVIIVLGSVPLVFASKFIPFVGILLVFLKIVLDVSLEEKEFAFWKKLEMEMEAKKS